MSRRVLLLGIYLVLACLISFAFAWAGHGSYAPFAVFYSWGFLIVEKEWVQSPTLAILLPSTYPILTFIASTLLYRKYGLMGYGGPLILHGIGAWRLLLRIEHGGLATYQSIAWSIGISVVVMGTYYAMDFILAKDQKIIGVLESSSPADICSPWKDKDERLGGVIKRTHILGSNRQ